LGYALSGSLIENRKGAHCTANGGWARRGVQRKGYLKISSATEYTFSGSFNKG